MKKQFGCFSGLFAWSDSVSCKRQLRHEILSSDELWTNFGKDFALEMQLSDKDILWPKFILNKLNINNKWRKNTNLSQYILIKRYESNFR